MIARRFVPCKACARPSAYSNGLCPICDEISRRVHGQTVPVDYNPRRAL